MKTCTSRKLGLVLSILAATQMQSCSEDSPTTASTTSKSQIATTSSTTPTSSGIIQSSALQSSSASNNNSARKVLFDDMSKKDGTLSIGQGLWFGDDDHTNGGVSTNLDANNRSVAQGLDASSCPLGADAGQSKCWVGWNVSNGDAYSVVDGKTVLSSTLSLSGFVNPSGWGWASAGWVVQFKGTPSDTIPYGFIPQDTLEIAINYPTSQGLVIKAYEKGYEDIDTHQRPFATIVGKGVRNVYKIPISSFKPSPWATNKFDAAQVYRLGIFKQVQAAKSGEAWNAKNTTSSQIEISCLGMNGACQ